MFIASPVPLRSPKKLEAALCPLALTTYLMSSFAHKFQGLAGGGRDEEGVELNGRRDYERQKS